MNKPKKKVRKSYDWNEIVEFIEKKYGFEIRDYHNFKYKVKDRYKYNEKHRKNWRKQHLGLDEFTTEYRTDPEGEVKEIPYLDFWHFIVDHHDIHNGCTITIDWEYLKEDGEEWQQEICQVFIDEFGPEIEVYICW